MIADIVETTREEVKHPDVEVLLGDLTGTEGNAFVILGRVVAALKLAGHDSEAYMAEATEGTYEDLLEVSRSWVRTYELKMNR